MHVLPAPDSRRLLRPLVDRHLDQVNTLKKPNTYRKYEAVLNRFCDSFHDRSFESISTEELNDFVVHLKKSGMESNTVLHNVVIIAQFFKRNGRSGIMRQLQLPERSVPLPKEYREADLAKFFAVCDPRERALFATFLMTGFREQEIMYLFSTDVNVALRTVRVTAKRDYGFSPKRWEEREKGVKQAVVSMEDKEAVVKCDSEVAKVEDLIKAVKQASGPHGPYDAKVKKK
jgi:site-specific recombinase XerC